MPNPTSFRLPFHLGDHVPDDVKMAFRVLFNANKDINDAVVELAARNKSASNAKTAGVITQTQTQTQAAAVSDTASLPMPSVSRFALWQATPTSPFFSPLFDEITYGASAHNSYLVPTATENAAMKFFVYTPFGLATNAQYQGLPQFYSGRSGSFETKIRMATAVEGIRVWAGLSDFSIYNRDTTVTFGNAIAFRYHFSDGNEWKCCVGTSAGMTVGDSGVAPSLTTSQLLQIRIDGTYANFFIDGQQVASIYTNYPSNVNFKATCSIEGDGSGVDGTGIVIPYIYASSATP